MATVELAIFGNRGATSFEGWKVASPSKSNSGWWLSNNTVSPSIITMLQNTVVQYVCVYSALLNRSVICRCNVHSWKNVLVSDLCLSWRPLYFTYLFKAFVYPISLSLLSGIQHIDDASEKLGCNPWKHMLNKTCSHLRYWCVRWHNAVVVVLLQQTNAVNTVEI